MNLTQFKRVFKGIGTNGKTLKSVKPIAHTEYVVSGTSDAVTHNTIIVVAPAYEKPFDIVTQRKEIVCYIINDLKQLQDKNVLKQVTQVYGLNYVFTLDSVKTRKCELLFTINRKTEKQVTKEIYEIAENLFAQYDATKEKNSELSNELKNILGENFTHETFKALAAEKGYNKIINELASDNRQQLQKFIDTYKFNPFDYDLDLITN